MHVVNKKIQIANFKQTKIIFFKYDFKNKVKFYKKKDKFSKLVKIYSRRNKFQINRMIKCGQNYNIQNLGQQYF